MPTVIEAGSDAACLCLYDPSAVPEALSSAKGRGRQKIIDQIVAKQRAWLLRTGGDGSFVVRIYVNEHVPDELSHRAKEKTEGSRLTLETDQLCLTGIEDVRRQATDAGDEPIRIAPGLSLPPGTYELSMWTFNWPEKAIADAYQKRAIAEFGAERWARYRKRSRFDVPIVISLMLSGVFCFFATLTKTGRNYFGWQGLVGLWALWLVAIQVIPRLRLEKDGERFAQLLRETERDFPDYVLQLRSL